MIYKEVIERMSSRASNVAKCNIKPVLVSSMLAGAFVALGGFIMLLMGSIFPADIKCIPMGIVFALALSLVMYAGSDLFTGHCMFQTFGWLSSKLNTIKTCTKGLLRVWLGNLLGAILICLIFYMTDISRLSETLNLIYITKTTYGILPLIFKGIMCNIFVCLPIWVNSSEDNRAVSFPVTLLCIFSFVALGFEHSVANMGIFTLALLNNPALSVLDGLYNLLFVTIGNIIGGMLVALPYYYLSKK